MGIQLHSRKVKPVFNKLTVPHCDFKSDNHKTKSKRRPDNKDQLFNPAENDLNFDLSLTLTAFSCRVQAVADRISFHAERMNDILTFTASVLPVEHEYIYS